MNACEFCGEELGGLRVCSSCMLYYKMLLDNRGYVNPYVFANMIATLDDHILFLEERLVVCEQQLSLLMQKKGVPAAHKTPLVSPQTTVRRHVQQKKSSVVRV